MMQRRRFMADLTSIELRRLERRLNRLLHEFSGVPFASFDVQGAWTPAVNAYCVADRIMICVDLAGVDRKAIDLTVEPQRVVLRGQRALPEPTRGDCPVEQVLAMEINSGPFERVLTLPEAVNP